MCLHVRVCVSRHRYPHTFHIRRVFFWPVIRSYRRRSDWHTSRRGAPRRTGTVPVQEETSVKVSGFTHVWVYRPVQHTGPEQRQSTQARHAECVYCAVWVFDGTQHVPCVHDWLCCRWERMQDSAHQSSGPFELYALPPSTR